MILTAGGLALATLASEDLACVAAGLLVARGQIDAPAAIAGCTIGIVAGDFGLWAVGRFGGRAALAWPWLARRVPPSRLEGCRAWLDRHAAGAIVASRFTPGTRLPLYITAGVVGMSPARFALWTLAAALLWTPAVVLASARAGGIEATGGELLSWPSFAVAAGLLLAMRAGRALASPAARSRLAARIARWRRWEFWPMWLFYAPVGVWVGLLALRYGGLTTVTAANPGIPDGGTVGESKHGILKRLPPEYTIPSAMVLPGPASERVRQAEWILTARGWPFPVVLKPDVGQRGVGVKLARSRQDLAAYLTAVGEAVLIQPYDPGPFEAGVFYYRMPGAMRGRILSITDKRFPCVIGDGESTLEMLIREHPRYRMQVGTFLARHAGSLGRVLARGERWQLALAGNHAQGTMFLDGAHLVTAALERRIDEIARSYPGFFVGRFDIRYRDVDSFRAGRDIAIVELNGATAESTNIYDPSTPLFSAYRQLFRQWSIVFRIGAANRKSGVPATPARRLLALVIAHLRSRPAYVVSD